MILDGVICAEGLIKRKHQKSKTKRRRKLTKTPKQLSRGEKAAQQNLVNARWTATMKAYLKAIRHPPDLLVQPISGKTRSKRKRKKQHSTAQQSVEKQNNTTKGSTASQQRLNKKRHNKQPRLVETVGRGHRRLHKTHTKALRSLLTQFLVDAGRLGILRRDTVGATHTDVPPLRVSPPSKLWPQISSGWKSSQQIRTPIVSSPLLQHCPGACKEARSSALYTAVYTTITARCSVVLATVLYLHRTKKQKRMPSPGRSYSLLIWYDSQITNRDMYAKLHVERGAAADRDCLMMQGATYYVSKQVHWLMVALIALPRQRNQNHSWNKTCCTKNKGVTCHTTQGENTTVGFPAIRYAMAYTVYFEHLNIFRPQTALPTFNFAFLGSCMCMCMCMLYDRMSYNSGARQDIMIWPPLHPEDMGSSEQGRDENWHAVRIKPKHHHNVPCPLCVVLVVRHTTQRTWDTRMYVPSVCRP